MDVGDIPKNILRARRFHDACDLQDCCSVAIVQAVRDLRKWLADPVVSDEVRAGDAELVVLLQEHLLESDQSGRSLYMDEGIARPGSRTRRTVH